MFAYWWTRARGATKAGNSGRAPDAVRLAEEAAAGVQQVGAGAAGTRIRAGGLSQFQTGPRPVQAQPTQWDGQVQPQARSEDAVQLVSMSMVCGGLL